MLILFLIYISEVFNLVSEFHLSIIVFSFVDDLRFISSESLIKNITFTLEKIAKMILQWGKTNAVIYNIVNTEAILFFKSHRERLNY